jgi:tetratricopeptide (TPR) repeat protein
MNARFSFTICFCAALALTIGSAYGQNPSDSYGQALGHYNKQEFQQAHALLTKLVDANSKDPRVYYFRGLSRYQLDREADARDDFESGARWEATVRSRVSIPRSLERVQGPARQILEKYRREAKRQANLDGTQGRFTRQEENERIFAEARASYFSGGYKHTAKLLDGLVASKSKDARVFYFRGLAQHQLGNSDAATADFTRAVTIETGTRRKTIDVDKALERVQGGARRALEEKRRVALNTIRRAEKERHRQMIAQLLAEEIASDPELAAIRRAGIGQPNAPATNPGTAGPTNPTPPNAAPTATVSTTPPAASGSKAVDLAWLPEDTAIVARLNVRALWSSPMVRQFHDHSMVVGVLAQMKQVTGLAPADIESITMGGPDVGPSALGGAAALSQAQIDQKVVVVARLRAPFDSSSLAALGYESADHNGKAYFTHPGAKDMPDLYMADSKTIVAGMGAGIKAAIDSAGKSDPRAEFDFLDASKQFVLAYIPDDPSLLTAAIPDMPLGMPGVDKLKDAAKDSLLGVAFSIGVKDSIELQFGFICLDAAVANDLNTAFDQTTKELKGMLDLVRAGLPAQVGGMADTLLRSVKSTKSKEIFAINITLSQQLIASITESASELGGLIPGLGLGGPGPDLPAAPGTAPPAAPGTAPAAIPPAAK